MVVVVTPELINDNESEMYEIYKVIIYTLLYLCMYIINKPFGVELYNFPHKPHSECEDLRRDYE